MRRFVLSSVPSVPHLEALLLLHAAPVRSWGAGQLALRLYLSEGAAAEVLGDLHAAGLLTHESAAPAFRFRPTNDDLHATVEHVAQAYADNLIGLSTLIHARRDGLG